MRHTWINTGLYLGTTVITALLGLASAVLMTHLLPPAEYGRIGVFLSMLYVAAPLVSLAAEGLVAVNKTALDAPDYDLFRRTAVAIALAGFCALQTGAVLLWALGPDMDPMLLLVPMLALLKFASTMASTEYVAEERAATYAGLTLFSSFAALLLTYLMISQFALSAVGRVLALMIAESVMLAFRYRGRWQLILSPTFHPKFRRQILAFGIPSLLALFGAWALNESDKTIVAQVFGLHTAGLYTAGATLAAIMNSFNQSLTNAFFPRLFAQLRTSTYSMPRLLWQWLLRFVGFNAAFAVLAVAAYMLAKDALIPAKYVEASSYFYALVAGSLGVAAYRPFGLIAEYFQMARTRAAAILCGGGCTLLVSSVGTRWLDTPLMAAVGMGAGYLLTMSILCVAILAQHDKRGGASSSHPGHADSLRNQ